MSKGQTALCAVLCRPVPSCAVLCRPVPSCAVLCRPVPSCAVVCRRVPSCAVVCRRVPSCAVVCRRVPSCAVVCRPVPSCAVVCRPVPSCAVLCRPVPSCAVLCRPVPSCAVFLHSQLLSPPGINRVSFDRSIQLMAGSLPQKSSGSLPCGREPELFLTPVGFSGRDRRDCIRKPNPVQQLLRREWQPVQSTSQ